MHFLQLCADICKKSSLLKEFAYIDLEDLVNALSENGIVYLVWLTVLETIVF